MSNATGFVKLTKRAAIDAMNSTKPVEVCFGKVTANSPLKILVEQKMTLGENQLVLCRNVTTYETEVTVEWQTGNKSGDSGDSAFASHNHSVSGRKKITIHNGLVVGDEVILLRQQGGQKYIVVDKIG